MNENELGRKAGGVRWLDTSAGRVAYFPLAAVLPEERIERLPYVVRVFLESLLRNAGRKAVEEDHIALLSGWEEGKQGEFPFYPARVILQDFTGVPAVADLAAMRSAVARMGGDPTRVNPVIPVDLVIDHSVQVDAFGTPEALQINTTLEMQRNTERYVFLRWAQKAFRNFRVVPPGTGIIHQVNLEYLAAVVATRCEDGITLAFPDTVLGTDSHTTMVSGLGVLGWGVGGIEAEAAMLGEPVYLLTPEVVGVRLVGRLPEGTTATDLVLHLTQALRKYGVVGKFVEFCGPGLTALSVPDRATVANMAPEYGATTGFFPVDRETLSYLRGSGRDPALVELVERYTRAQHLFREETSPEPSYKEVLEFDLSQVEPSLAGPRRPHDRLRLSRLPEVFRQELAAIRGGRGERGSEAGAKKARVKMDGAEAELGDGSVVIAAITSCTNTSNPGVLVTAGLLAKKAVERGMKVAPTVKTSLAPGSRVVVDYLSRLGLLEPLAALGFHVVGFGCTTCIGNSGPLPEPVERAIKENQLVAAAVLSGNRNFEGRIHPQVRMAFLASPPLVVALALAGRVDIDLEHDPLGVDAAGNPVYLRDLWPTAEEVAAAASASLDPELYRARYASVFEGTPEWQSLPTPTGDLFSFDPSSTYIAEPPFFRDLSPEPPPLEDIRGGRVLAWLGDSVTTDHISPAGSIPPESPAGRYLISRGVEPGDFNTYGSRRGNHEVMVRGTFANIRLKNRLVPGVEGGFTLKLPEAEETTVYEAAEAYRAEGVPLIVVAGKEYGSGSSRDWAAKGTLLLGVRAVLAESYERIHRSNLVQMGVLPLQFMPGENADSLGLTGREVIEVIGIAEGLYPRKVLTVRAHSDGEVKEFQAVARLDTHVEVEYYRNGGILPAVVREILRETGRR